jgi:hypothetical protein
MRPPKVDACIKLTTALREEATRIQDLHDGIQADDVKVQVTSSYTGNILLLYEAANKTALDVSARISDYKNLGGELPSKFDFERRTDVMISNDLPVLKEGLTRDPDGSESPWYAWNELTQYADFARQIAKMNCGQ